MGQSAIEDPPAGERTVGAYTLTLEAGAHAGVVQRLPSGSYAIGRDLDADVVLADPYLEPRHAVLSLTGGRAAVRAVDGSIDLPGGRRLAPGQERCLSLPFDVAMGGTRMRLAAPPAKSGRSGWRTTLFGAAVLCAAIVIPVETESSSGALAGRPSVAAAEAATSVPVFPAVVVDSGAEDEGERAVALRSAVHAAVSAGVERGGQLAAIESAPNRFRLTGFVPTAVDRAAIEQMFADGPRGVDIDLLAIDDVAEALRTRLVAAGLADAIRVVPGFGTIAVDGTIDPAMQPAWEATQAWFDQRFAQRIVMVCDVVVSDADAGPQLTVEAVWAGDRPYVVAADGRRYGEGAALDNGWQLDRIEADRLVISRGGQWLALTF